MNVPLSLPQYFSVGVALAVLGRAIQYVAVTRYLKERSIAITRTGLVPDWKEWAAYRKSRLSEHKPLTWWYVLWTIQVILLFWIAGWIANGTSAVKIATPSPLPPSTGDVGDYWTAFDVTRSGYRQWSFAASGLILVVAGLAVPTLIRIGIFRKPPPWMQKWFPRVVVGFAIMWTLVSFIATYTDYRTAVNAMRDNRAHVIEGVVTDFRPMPYAGHGMESFVVQGVRFEYSDFVITAGFNKTSSHNGPIREGLRVKIWHLGGEILRLDVARGSTPPLQSTAGLPDGHL